MSFKIPKDNNTPVVQYNGMDFFVKGGVPCEENIPIDGDFLFIHHIALCQANSSQHRKLYCEGKNYVECTREAKSKSQNRGLSEKWDYRVCI